MEPKLNRTEVKLLKLLEKKDCKPAEFSKLFKNIDFRIATQVSRSNHLFRLVCKPGESCKNNSYQITTQGREWLKAYRYEINTIRIPIIISNAIAFAALIISIIALVK